MNKKEIVFDIIGGIIALLIGILLLILTLVFFISGDEFVVYLATTMFLIIVSLLVGSLGVLFIHIAIKKLKENKKWVLEKD